MTSLLAVVKRLGPSIFGLLGPSCNVVDPRPGPETPTAPIIWHHVDGPAGFGPPAFDGAAAYFVTQDHRVLALDSKDGRTLWEHTTRRTDGTALRDGRTFFGCAVVQEAVICGDDELIAFNRVDGRIRWRYQPEVGSSPGYYEGAIVNSVIFAGSPYGAISAVDGVTGGQLWATQLFAPQPQTLVIDPTADSGVVVAPFKTFTKPATGGVVALDPKTGKVRWIKWFPSYADTLSGGRGVMLWRNLVLGSSESGHIYAMDRETGSVLWSLPDVGGRTPPAPGFPSGYPVGLSDDRQLVVDKSILYVASSSEWFHAYDLDSRSMLWRMTAQHGSASGQRISTDGARVYVIHASGQLVAFSTTEPKILWESGRGLNEGYFGRVSLGPDRIFLGGKQGFYAIAK
jgi:outer membrane protein assembly factor BamB